MPLTDTAVRNAKPGEKPIKMFDEKGLFLIVTPAGGKWWRLRYRMDGKEKLLALGTYPDVSLKKARERRDAARVLIADGVDPNINKKEVKAEQAQRAINTFEAVAREWHEKKKSSWVEKHGIRVMRLFERDIFPWIGSKSVGEVKPKELLECLRRVEKRGSIQTAHRLLTFCGQAFRYAIATDCAERDIAADLRDALDTVEIEHFAAVTDPKRVGELLRMFDAYRGTAVVCAALKLAPLLFVRPGELRHAEWVDVNLETAEWRYSATKTKHLHIVPLSTQAVGILRGLHELTGHCPYVFPSARGASRPMSGEAIRMAMRTIGIPADEMSGHGFRAMARTILDEVLGFRIDFIEHQLAHKVRDPNGRAYNRTAHLAERKLMMQAWSDYLDKLKAGAEIISLRGNAA